MSEQSHPFFFTWSAQKGAKGLEIVDGQGAHFHTSDGAQWLDLAALVYQAHLGHGEKRVVDAVVGQAQALCLTLPSAVYPAKTKLAELLLELAPAGFSKVFFTLGGAEANENAVKIARVFTGRHKMVSRYRSYHGASLGALSLTGDRRRLPFEPAVPGVCRALDCYCDRCPFGQKLGECHLECAGHIETILELEGSGNSGVAAVILESIPGANGVMVPPKAYWQRVREACTKNGSLLIADEVLTGFGRTGKCFGFENFDVVPDLITVGKALTGGYGVLGAVLVHERVANYFDDHVLLNGLTHYAHPLGCAAGVAAIEVSLEDGLFTRAAELEAPLRTALLALQSRFPERVEFVRVIGLLAALELKTDEAEWGLLMGAIEGRHLLIHSVKATRTVVLSPPLCISEADLLGGIEQLGNAFAEIF